LLSSSRYRGGARVFVDAHRCSFTLFVVGVTVVRASVAFLGDGLVILLANEKM
jgi:hypothetical protein